MNKITKNIEGYNADGICVGCLHYNRKMFAAEEANEFFRLLGNIEVQSGRSLSVCWECLAAIRTVSQFQAQLLKSFEVLTNYSKKHRHLEAPFDLTKHSTTRLTSQAVSRTSTEWQADTSGSNIRPVDDSQHNTRPREKEIHLKIEDQTMDPLGGFDSDFDPREFAASPVASTPASDDEVVQLANKLSQNPTNSRRKVPRRRGVGDRFVSPERQAKTLSEINNKVDWIVGSQKEMLHMLGLATQNPPMSLDNSFSCLQQITNLESLQEMDSLLRDKDYRRKLVISCSMLCNRGTNGTTCAYRLMDLVFSREFLCECSWSGGTRSEGEKIGFKFYRNVIAFFFETVQQWDSSFTYVQNETFLKTVLKNAKQRSCAKLTSVRNSTMKRRPKRPKTSEAEGSATGNTSYPPAEIDGDLSGSDE